MAALEDAGNDDAMGSLMTDLLGALNGLDRMDDDDDDDGRETSGGGLLATTAAAAAKGRKHDDDDDGDDDDMPAVPCGLTPGPTMEPQRR